MKTVSFFTEKGGEGKTTLSVLFASWLAYCQKERVQVLDFDHPTFQFSQMRNNDLNLYSNPANRVLIREASRVSPYPVNKIHGKNGYSLVELNSMVKSLKEQKEKLGNGYLVLDFPGRFLPSDPAYHLMVNGAVDLVVYLVDSDRQSRAAVVTVNSVLNPMGQHRQDVIALWNREHRDERTQVKKGKKDIYEVGNGMLRALGIPVISRKMRDILIARRDSDTFGFIRSTICWPEANIKAKCPYIYDIFSEVKSRLDGNWEDKPFVDYEDGEKEVDE